MTPLRPSHHIQGERLHVSPPMPAQGERRDVSPPMSAHPAPDTAIPQHFMPQTFANGPRSVLRQDPDIIMLGEIRDHETAVMAIQSSLTGHMVFSTLHTNDAASAVTRLLDLGIEPYLASSSLQAVLAQR